MPVQQRSIPPRLRITGDWRVRALGWMGGAKVMGRTARSELEMAQAIAAGLPTEALEHAIAQSVLSWSDVQTFIMPRRTLSHRKARGERLTSEESDRLVRLLRVIARAQDTFQSPDKAQRWLHKPNRALGGAVPFGLLKTSSGARLVEQVLDRIAYGVFS